MKILRFHAKRISIMTATEETGADIAVQGFQVILLKDLGDQGLFAQSIILPGTKRRN